MVVAATVVPGLEGADGAATGTGGVGTDAGADANAGAGAGVGTDAGLGVDMRKINQQGGLV